MYGCRLVALLLDSRGSSDALGFHALINTRITQLGGYTGPDLSVKLGFSAGYPGENGPVCKAGHFGFHPDIRVLSLQEMHR